MNAVLYLEGGGDSKELHNRCREGFRKLLERCGFKGRMPRLVACGSRNAAFDDFLTAHSGKSTLFIGLWIDSEFPITSIEKTWEHLQIGDSWARPEGANDDQVLLITTCMESWLITDRVALKQHYGSKLQETALPPLTSLETRKPQEVLDSLVHATRACANAYSKGKRSFEVLGILTPETLKLHLPSFVRASRILNENL